MSIADIQDWGETFNMYSSTSLGTCAFIITSSYFCEVENIDPLKTKEYSDEERLFMLRHAELMCYIASAIPIEKSLATSGYSNLAQVEQLTDKINGLIYGEQPKETIKGAVVATHNKLIRNIYALVSFESVARWMFTQDEGKNLLPPSLAAYIQDNPISKKAAPDKTQQKKTLSSSNKREETSVNKNVAFIVAENAFQNATEENKNMLHVGLLAIKPMSENDIATELDMPDTNKVRSLKEEYVAYMKHVYSIDMSQFFNKSKKTRKKT